MTRIDFYILQDVELDALHRFACRLAGKAWSAGNHVHIHSTDEDHATLLDGLLWEYPSERFIPHQVVNAPTKGVSIGWQEPAELDDVLINISGAVPGFFGRFNRVAEIVVDSTRDAGRDRYKFYRDRGFPLFHHELDDWETP